MAKKKENLKGMKEAELKKELSKLQEGLRTLRFNAGASKSKNVKEAALAKKQIARILTELNSKQNSK